MTQNPTPPEQKDAGLPPDEHIKKLSHDYADGVYRSAGCSPNTDGKWWIHRADFEAGVQAGLKMYAGLLASMALKIVQAEEAARKAAREMVAEVRHGTDRDWDKYPPIEDWRKSRGK